MITRSIIAKYLRCWRKLSDIKKTSEFFGHGSTKTVQILRKSKQYLKSSKRKAKNYRYLKIKGHPLRNKIATYLREWKNGMSSDQIATKYGSDKKTVLHYLGQSNQYSVSTRLLSEEHQMEIKGSPFRRKLTGLLSVWRKCRSLPRTASLTGISRTSCQRILMRSRSYRRNINVFGGTPYSRSDVRFVLRFAKKLYIVNKMGGCCVDCQNNNIFVLEFHHHDENKESGVSEMLESNIEAAVLEAEKCTLLCRNCHIIRHSNVADFERLKKIIMHKSVRL